jgi:superfamily II DNA or RNA helicase
VNDYAPVIRFWNSRSRIYTPDKGLLKRVRDVCSANGVSLAQIGVLKDGMTYATFPTGLLKRVMKVARVGREALRDMRVRPSWTMQPDLATWLRDYQIEGIRLLATRTRVLLRSPTGSGKGEVVAGIAAAAPHARILVLTPRATLVNDLTNRIENRAAREVYVLGTHPNLDEPCVQIATYTKAALLADIALPRKKRKKPDDAKPVSILHAADDLIADAAVASLNRERPEPTEAEREAARKLFASFDVLICDEAHTIAAESYYHAVRLCENAYYRVGLSATPTERTDGKNLYILGAFSDIESLAEFDALIERGMISDYDVVWSKYAPIPQTPLPKSFASQYEHCIVNNDARNRAVLGATYKAPKPVIVFTERLDHAEALLSRWQDKMPGSVATLATGDVSKAQREAIVNGAKSGEVEVIFATRVFAEGIDIPNLAAVVNAAGYKAPIPLLQRIGRGMRKHEGKDKFIVYDFLDDVPWLPKNWPRIHARRRAAELKRHHGK